MSPSPRRRGAPLGNHNNLRHGIYSKHISTQVDAGVESMPPDRNIDELALARTRLVACLEQQVGASPEDWLKYERAISYYLLAISRFIHNNAILGKDRRPSLVTVLEMIRQVNDKDHVK